MTTPSLRRRLLTLLTAGVALVVVLATLLVDRVVERELRRSFDDALTAKARVLVTLTKLWPEGVELDFADEFMPEFTDLRDPAFFQVRLHGGPLVELSESFLFEGVAAGSRLEMLSLPADQPRLWDVELPDGRAGRQVQVDFRPQLADELEEALEDGRPAWRADEGALGAGGPADRPLVSIAVAVERGSFEERLLAVRLLLCAMGALVLLTLIALAALSLHLGLRPVHRLAAEVQVLDERELDRRFDVGALPRELRPIGEQLNGLLERIARALQRERQLTSDIAHDLKTPVAELRTLCDVAVRFPGDAEATARFFEDAREVARTLERTIERLLALARHDAGREQLQRESFDLAELLRTSEAVFHGEARARGVGLELELPPELMVRSDRDRVATILGNLLENAGAHAPAGSSARGSLRSTSGGGVRFELRNAAPGLEPTDLEHLFERFWRKDDSRGDAAHAGLGLALAKADAELLGACLEAGLDEGDFVIALVLPAGTASRAA